jgi:nucleoid-associated protein YgaU
MMKNKTGLVALIVLAAATLLMVFFVLPNMDKDKPAQTPVAKVTDATPAEGGETTTAEGKKARAGAETDAAATGEAAATAGEKTEPTIETGAEETAKAEAKPANPAAGWVTPAFDLLRVEPDGSTVVAGRGEPNTTLEIKNGETVVATADVGPSGDFAAVFEKPLPAGDYQLTLNTKDGTGASKTSEEVATVSVPKDAGGDLLAMVSRPGEASRLITLPEAGAAAAGNTAGTANGTPDATAGDTAAASAEGQPAAAETVVAKGDTDVAPAASTATGASSEGTADKASTGAPTRVEPGIRVSAVELEGDRMFIAGSARPGALVRIYANEKLVGEAKADAEGRFVVDGKIVLTVGRHTIRADMMRADGTTIDMRASVPFDRPEGEQVAVVAQENATGDTSPALGLVGGGTFDRLRGEADKAIALLKGLYAGGRLPSAEELAAARSATEIALKSLSEFRPGVEEGAAARKMAEKASAAAAAALARLRALPGDAAGVGAGLGSIETAVAEALAPAIEKAEAAAGTVSATVSDAVATATENSIEALEGQARAFQQEFAALFSTGRNATTAEIQTARSALETALKRITGFAPAGGTSADVVAAIDRLKGWAKTAIDRLAAVPAGAGADAYRQALVALEGMPSLAGGADAAASAGTVGSQAATGGEGATTAAGEGTSATGQTAGSSDTQTAQPETVEQAPLKPSKTSVIIRRGDTLWQISRRIYGKGVRYTTIYLANEDLITNPDRINPGQVFGVPDDMMETDVEAEQLHRKRVRGQ